MIEFRPLPHWPHEDTNPRKSRHTFKARWQQTVTLINRELEHLDAENAVLQAGFRERDIRLTDGLPRADARTPQHPGIILSFESRHGPLSYRTDEYDHWEANLRAIGLGLEALRAVDRYGISKSGEQYKGWHQLTAGSGVTSREQAVATIARLGEFDNWAVANADEEKLRRMYRTALRAAHPDQGGTGDLFAAVHDAGRILGLR